MQIFPVLYDRDISDNIRVWWAEIDGNKHRVRSGIENGAIVCSEWTVCTPKNVGSKNERGPEQQAEFEVQSMYAKKKKQGYYEDRELAGTPLFVKPMLAKPSHDAKNTFRHPENLIIQKKLNGHRCIATKAGLFTRTGERIRTCPHIEEAVYQFLKDNNEAFLDGELYNYDYRQHLNELTSLIRKQTPNQDDLAKSKEILQYWIYDGDKWNGCARHYVNRKKQLDQIVKDMNSPYILSVKDHDGEVEDHEQVYQAYLADGEEGVIYRVKDSYYEHKRSKNLVKRKEVMDGEFTIVDIREGQGNWSGVAKIVDLTDGTNNFSSSFKGSVDEARKCLQNKGSWIGKTVTIKYFGLTGLGIPNYAQFDYQNCLGGEK